MPSEQTRFWLEAIASLAGIVGLFVVASELLRARKADAREFLFHEIDKFSELHEARRLVENLSFENYDQFLAHFQTHDKSLLSIFNFWDALTRTVRDGIVDTETALDHFGRVFMYSYYIKYSKAHHEFRDIEGNPEWFANFDWFAKEYARIKPGDWDRYLRGRKYITDNYPESVFAEKP